MTINSPRFIKDVEIERRHVRNRDAQLKDDRGAIKVGKGRGGEPLRLARFPYNKSAD